MKIILLSLFCVLFSTVVRTISDASTSTTAQRSAEPVLPQHLSAKVSAAVLRQLQTQQSVEVLVQFNGAADLSAASLFRNRVDRIHFVYRQAVTVTAAAQAQTWALLRQRQIHYRSYHINNSLWIPEADAALVDQLAKSAEVQFIGPNLRFRNTAIRPAIPASGSEKVMEAASHLSFIKVDQVWAQLGVKGQGIVIANQDSGVHWMHPALRRSYRGWGPLATQHDYNWHDAIHKSFHPQPSLKCPAKSEEPCDDSGHGTHTLGSMIGDDGGENQIGVAPQARWIGCRNMDRNIGSVTTYLECFEFFLAPYPQGGNPATDGRADMAPHIINNSWACPSKEGCQGPEFLQTVRVLKAAGIMVVAAAGNEGPNCGTMGDPPGSYVDEVLTAGAYNRYQNDIAFFSSRGPSAWNRGWGPDVITAGENIRSSVVPGTGENRSDYDSKGGTSMASPQVAGVIALMWSAKPALAGRIDETVQILRQTATPTTASQSCGGVAGNQIPNAVFGFGIVNALKAVQESQRSSF